MSLLLFFKSRNWMFLLCYLHVHLHCFAIHPSWCKQLCFIYLYSVNRVPFCFTIFLSLGIRAVFSWGCLRLIILLWTVCAFNWTHTRFHKGISRKRTNRLTLHLSSLGVMVSYFLKQRYPFIVYLYSLWQHFKSC